jgi:hypothetical protein
MQARFRLETGPALRTAGLGCQWLNVFRVVLYHLSGGRRRSNCLEYQKWSHLARKRQSGG